MSDDTSDRKQRRTGERVARLRDIEAAAAKRKGDRPTATQVQKAIRRMRRWAVDPELQVFTQDAPALGAETLEALNHRLWQVQAEIGLQNAAYRAVLLEELEKARASGDAAGVLKTLATLTDLTLRTAGTVKRVVEAQANLSKLHVVHELDKQLSEVHIKVDGWRDLMAEYADRAASADGSDDVH